MKIYQWEIISKAEMFENFKDRKPIFIKTTAMTLDGIYNAMLNQNHEFVTSASGIGYGLEKGWIYLCVGGVIVLTV